MPEQKTHANKASVDTFLNPIENETRRLDSKKFAALLAKATRKKQSRFTASPPPLAPSLSASMVAQVLA